MAKKRSWFNLVKRLFISEAKAKPEKKEKRRRWILGRLRWRRMPALAAPSSVKDTTLIEAEEEHSKHALSAAIATAAAAKAAVASAQSAIEIVRLSGTSQSYLQMETGNQELQTNRGTRGWAAIKIQTAFRGYLARKALRALKGLVRLQAMVRGQAVRRKAVTALKGLQSLVKIQSQIRSTRVRLVENNWTSEEKKQPLRHNKEAQDAETRLEINYQRRRYDNFPSKEEIDAMFLSRKEALIKREWIKEYLISHRERRNANRLTEPETEPVKVNWRSSHWLEKWVKAEERKNGGLRELQNYEHLEELNSPLSPPRRSFHKPKRSLVGDTDSFSRSPTVPNYMSVTESAKAKSRSISSPQPRLGLLDTYSDHGSPCKNRFSFSSVIGKPQSYQQRSPTMNGLLGPIKSQRISKGLSFDSECLLLNWDQQRDFSQFSSKWVSTE